MTRSIPAFLRFFDTFSYSHGELTNYSNIARDCGIDSKTVKEYYQILVDTLLAVRVEPFKKRQVRNIITKTRDILTAINYRASRWGFGSCFIKSTCSAAVVLSTGFNSDVSHPIGKKAYNKL